MMSVITKKVYNSYYNVSLMSVNLLLTHQIKDQIQNLTLKICSTLSENGCVVWYSEPFQTK